MKRSMRNCLMLASLAATLLLLQFGVLQMRRIHSTGYPAAATAPIPGSESAESILRLLRAGTSSASSYRRRWRRRQGA